MLKIEVAKASSNKYDAEIFCFSSQWINNYTERFKLQSLRMACGHFYAHSSSFLTMSIKSTIKEIQSQGQCYKVDSVAEPNDGNVIVKSTKEFSIHLVARCTTYMAVELI